MSGRESRSEAEQSLGGFTGEKAVSDRAQREPQSRKALGPRTKTLAHRAAWVLFVLLFTQPFFTLPSILWLLVLASALFMIALASKKSWLQVVAVNLSAAILAVSIYEFHLARSISSGDGTRIEGSILEDFIRPDEMLGYRPRAGLRVSASKWLGDKVIYDVFYTINEHGFRVTSTPEQSGQFQCVIFFGDSVSFGEGVNDHEAFAYRAPSMASGLWQSYNLAFSGWGPHQMLALLQDGLPSRLAKCRSPRVIHLTILEHVPRVAGLASWDRHGPRYKLDANGRPARDGNFDSPTRLPGGWESPRWLRDTLDGSRTWQRVFGRDRVTNERDFQLYLAVLRESVRRVRAEDPAGLFDLILWDGRNDDRLARIESSMQNEGATVHRLTRIIEDYPGNADRYLLNPHDGHPNALMHERIAAYVARHILVP